ncbi:methionine--tRNA ligase [Nocardia beijingensis]|uniref:Methionine--tRNA ligase n=1 Tax=Nocardia beijingensis TaxID=95162 RepID=A0ABW7W7U1_9NOCA
MFVGVAWPYANGSLHAGHLAGAYLPADIFARYQRIAGANVLFVSGTDCHGTPITLHAEAEGATPREIAERYHRKFVDYWAALGISFDEYTTTMTDNHIAVVQDEFLLLRQRGFLFEKPVKALYDVAAQRFLPDRYILGTCPHCGAEDARGDQCESCGRPMDPDKIVNPVSRISGNAVELRPTSHFYLDLPKLEERLSGWISSKSSWRKHVYGETMKFLREGLQARAITRDIEWGVPIPLDGYDDRRIYVWFEAVTGYLSASIEWAGKRADAEEWKKWWLDPNARQYYFLGKDNIPFHTIIWPGILMARGDIPQLPHNVPANGFLTFAGEKASKSRRIGATLDELVADYQPDAIRYYLTSILPESDDSVFEFADLKLSINNGLLSTWGNLVSRTFALVSLRCDGRVPQADIEPEVAAEISAAFDETAAAFEEVEIRRAFRRVLKCARFANAYLNAREPWRKGKPVEEVHNTLGNAVHLVNALHILFAPFLPFSSEEVARRLGYDAGVPVGRGWVAPEPIAGRTIEIGDSLFIRTE